MPNYMYILSALNVHSNSTDEDHIDEGNRQGEQSGIHGANRDRTSIESEQDIVHVAPFNRSASPQDDRDDYHDGEYSEHGNQYTDIVREYYEPLRESRETSLEPATPSAYPVSLPSTPAGDQGDDEQFSKTETDELDETPHLPSDAKPWFQRAFDSVSSIDLGPRFRELLTLYIQVESIQEYEESKKRFQKDGRPVELSTWILSGRWRIKRRPQIKDLDTFKKSWWNWWINMQPRWREINTTRNRPVQEMYGRSWHRLIAPGRNGWLSVVACLYWWGCTICDDNGKAKMEFEEAVKDTIFMMEGFLSYMKGLRMSPEV